MTHRLRGLALFSILSVAAVSNAGTLKVGPGQTYQTPCQAFPAAAAGDIIEIDAGGSYAGDVCAVYQSSLTIRGMNGRAVIDAGGRSAEGKGIWVVKGSNIVIENIEFKNAKVTDRNGAGIRHEGTGLTIRNSYFHHNENGILTGANANNEILIERSEFAFNGYGDGQSHNMYIGKIKKFTLKNSFSHDAVVGHLVKSRAEENHILYNRLTNENNGSASYEIDLPNGGRSYVIGNVIQQGPSAQNSAMVAFGMEGPTNANNDFYLINNTFVNDRSTGYFVNINSAVTTAAVAKNNIFAGTGQVFNTTNVVNQGNYVNAAPQFVNRAGYDYHPVAGAAYLNVGVAPGTSSTGLDLTPTLEYVHPISSMARLNDGKIDIGAFEYGSTGTPTPTPEPAPTPTPTPTPAPDTTAPTVSITLPANGSYVPRSSWVQAAVNAVDNVGVKQVTVFVNGIQICQKTVAPYACTFQVSNRSGRKYRIQATATDAAGNKGTSSLVTVTTR